MKKLSSLVIRLVIMSVLVVGGLACGKSDNKSTEVPKQVSMEVSDVDFQKASESNGGVVNKTVEVASGDSIMVKLWYNATTGYSWPKSATISDPGVLQLAGYGYEHEAPPTGLLGADGKAMWTFKSSKAGVCEVSMDYSQPWEGGQKNTYRFLLTVTVK